MTFRGGSPPYFILLLAILEVAWEPFTPGLARAAGDAAPGYSTATGAASVLPKVVTRRADSNQVLNGPSWADAPQPPRLTAAQPAQSDQPLPINLATALRLSNARPLVIAFAETAVRQADAVYRGARVLWLPDLNVGLEYYRHSGADQATDGTVIFDAKNAFAAGGGATLVFGVTDAIFLPLAARQELAARQWDVQSARNDALLAVAVAYFDVEQARGNLAAALDAVVKGRDLERRIASLGKGLVPEIEADRARTLLADLRQQVEAARAAWRVASARLTRILRLNPGAVVVPLEPPHLQITLVPPGYAVDDLIPIGLMSRPELASQRALVQATLYRLRQERLRPLLPSAVLQGATGPGGELNGAIFGGGSNNGVETWGGRFDVDMGLVWTLKNFGLGNRALVRERAAEQQAAVLALFDIQDRVAQEVVQAEAELEAAAAQVGEAATEVKEALFTYQGNVKGLGQTIGAGDLLQTIIRPQEAVAALQALIRAYQNYYAAVAGYNRAEFALYHALGYPSRILASDCPPGAIQPVDLTRPPQMAPVCPHVVSSPDR